MNMFRTVAGTGGLRRCEKGNVAIEFALVAPLLFFMIGAIFETGAFVFTQTQLQFAAQNAAYQLKMNNAPTSVADFKTQFCNDVMINDCLTKIAVDVQRAANFATLATTARPVIDVAPGSDVYNSAQPSEAGSVIVTYDWEFVFPFMGDMSMLMKGWRAGLGFGNVPNNPKIRRLYGSEVYMAEPQ